MNDKQPLSATDREPARWSLVRAAVMCPFRPAATAWRTRHISLLRVYVAHLLAAALTVFAIISLVAIGQAATFRKSVVELALNLVADLVVTGISVAVIELAFLALALILTPWGALDEPVRSSYRHALRQTWVHTSHAILLALVIGFCVITLDRLGDAWGASASDDWQVWSIAPWYVRHPDFVVLHVVFACIFWFLWALLRAVSAHRLDQIVARSPTCEACGYNLTLQPMDSRCPECGEAVAASLGPGVRPGAPWQRRHNIGRLPAWWQTTWAAIFHPRRFGQLLRFQNSRANPVCFLLVHLPVVWLLVAGFVLYGTQRRPPPEVWFFQSCLSGYLAVLAVLGVTSFAALLAGVSQRFSYKRNLMPIAVQAACYLSGYATLCVGLFFLIAATGDARPIQVVL